MNGLKPFALERFFAKYEFTAKHLLCCSDCESLGLEQLLELADADSLARWKNLRLGYGETQGLPALREEVAKLYSTVRPDELVICAPEEGIYLTMQALVKAGDHVVVVSPAYQSLYEVVEALGGRVSRWEVELQEDGGAAFKVEALKELMEPSTKLVVVNFPHNPTGALPTPAEWGEIVECCRAAGAWLFSDEMYKFLESDPSRQLPSAVDLYPAKGISLCGVSKSLGGPGLRIGWVVSHDSGVLEQVMQLKDYTTICSSVASEVLALMAVRSRESLWQTNLDIIRTNIAAAEAFFKKWKGSFAWQPPAAGPVCFPRLTRSEMDIDKFCDWVVSSCGVLLLPATQYNHSPSAEGGHFRLGLGRRNFPECLQALDEFLVQQAEQGAW